MQKAFKHIFWLGIGLSLVGLLSLNANIPRYFLEYYFSVEILGIYATIMYFATISLNIVITINQSLIAELAKTAAESIRAFYNFFIKILLFYLAAITIGNIILFTVRQSAACIYLRQDCQDLTESLCCLEYLSVLSSLRRHWKW